MRDKNFTNKLTDTLGYLFVFTFVIPIIPFVAYITYTKFHF